MKTYLLTMNQPVGGRPDPEALERIMTEVEAIRADLRENGRWVFGGGLHEPSASTVLRSEGEEVLTIDGPFAEGKEHIGGLTIVRAADLDEALEIGRRYAKATTLPIEVRPFIEEGLS